MLIYKAELKGIKVILTEESYTSRASFLTLDSIPTYERERGSEFKSTLIALLVANQLQKSSLVAIAKPEECTK